MAKLTAVYGPMFAGKTTWIIQKINELERQGRKCLVIKPRLDNRYGKEAKLHSHNGKTGEAVLVDENNPQTILGIWTEMYEQHDVVVIDEVMFFDKSVVAVVKEMLARELNVIVAGLDTDFRREPFGVMPQLIKLSDEQAKLSSVCYKCGQVAEYSARLVNSTDQLVVGAGDSYQPSCGECHTIPFSFPNLRPNKGKSKVITIEVGADSMRVGKTTAVKVIVEGLRKKGIKVVESYEDWQHNPYLKKSYEDPAKNFLESQKWFAKRKHEQIADGVILRQDSGMVNIFVQDVSPETDYAYAVTSLRLGRMSPADFAQYDDFYRRLDWTKAPKPDLLVYLEVSDEVLLARAEVSRREFETVDDEYFLTMKQVNREWLREQDKIIESVKGGDKHRVLRINTDKLDYAGDKTAQTKLIKMVEEVIGIF